MVILLVFFLSYFGAVHAVIVLNFLVVVMRLGALFEKRPHLFCKLAKAEV